MRRFGDALPLAQTDITDRGGVFAFVGPTGVGKTTTIAKIAARFVLRHGVDALGLVSTDTYRIGARQQLSNYARILRAPLHVAETSEELRRILDGFQSKKLVLIDTAGMSQRDVRLANQFATLRVEGHRVEPVIVLSAGADRGCLAEALRVFQSANPESLVITKLDEAAALGGVLSLAIRAGLPIAYLSDGQRVPEDLHLAAPKRFWLMHNAVKLTQGAPPLDENELAVEFRRDGADDACVSRRSIRRPACADSALRSPSNVIAITGGKGGVGKTVVAVNLGAALAAQGRSTMLLDADLGLANVDVLLGFSARLNLEHVVNGECALDDVILTAPCGLRIVPAASGSADMASLDRAQHAGLVHAFSRLLEPLDVLLVDTAAGVGDA